MIQKIKNKIYNFLRWSERYTKTDMVYFTKGNFWLTLSQIGGMLSSFILTLVMANLLDQNVYGAYKYILSIISVITITSLPGMNIAAFRSASRGYEGTLKRIVFLKMKWGLLGSLACLILGAYYYINNNLDLSYSYLIASLFIPLMDSLRIPIYLLSTRKLFNAETTSINYLINIFQTTIVIISVLISKNLLIIITCYLFAFTAVRFLANIYIWNKFKPNDKHEESSIKYGWSLTFIQIITAITNNINNINIGHLIGNIKLAAYSIGIAPVEQLKTLISMNDVLYSSKLSNNNWEIPNFKKFVQKILPFILVLSIFNVIYLFISPLFYKLFFPKYLESILYSQLYSLTIIPSAIVLILNSILKSKMLVREQKIINYFNCALCFVVNIPAIYFFGIIGLIFAILINKLLEITISSYLIFVKRKLS